ncbi:CAP domain-containing protein [Desulforamulus ferrireducens]|nr:CAP domain-containing protein [Desulforamulus ferrireducens]
MKKIICNVTGIIVGTFVFALAMIAPGMDSAAAATNYYGSYQPDYSKYSTTTTTTGNTTNYSQYSTGTTTTGNTTDYSKYSTTSTGNTTVYNNKDYIPNYSNYQNMTTNTTTQPTQPAQPTQPTQPAPSQPTTTQPTTPTTTQPNNVSVSDEQAMIDLINQERKAAGLQPLSYDEALTEQARLKAQDMISNNYFGHTSPTYGTPFEQMKSAGISYRYAGENLAGAPDVNTAHQNLMNSPTHKANILKEEYTKVGVGVINGGPYGKMYVQMYNG